MLRRLRRHRSLWAALAAGLMAVPALLGGVAAAPAQSTDSGELPPPELNPLEGPPPDPANEVASRLLSQSQAIADLAPADFRMLVIAAANRHRVDPRLVAAVITVETHWDPHAVGGHGELGLMQILPSTGAFLAEERGLAEYDLADMETNLDLGAYYLASLTRAYGDPLKALAAYNGGPRAVENWQTNIYVRKVRKHYDAIHHRGMPAGTVGFDLQAS